MDELAALPPGREGAVTTASTDTNSGGQIGGAASTGSHNGKNPR